jgi:hypothetical protein
VDSLVDYLRFLAGGFVGAGALMLLYTGEITAGVALLATMLGFFVGEKNGAKQQKAAETPA